jgi:hypothetical protein
VRDLELELDRDRGAGRKQVGDIVCVWTQGKGFGYVMAEPMAALLIVAAKTVYDYRNAPFKSAHANARTETYFAEQSGSFCVMEGVWHNWEEDEAITLGCLEVKGNIREGSYRLPSTPPRRERVPFLTHPTQRISLTPAMLHSDRLS